MADHGTSGTHHIDGSPSTGDSSCEWSEQEYLAKLNLRGQPLDRRDDPSWWGSTMPTQADIDAVDMLDGFAAHQMYAGLLHQVSQVDAMRLILALDRKIQAQRKP